MDEARVHINGVALTAGNVMALRVAAEVYLMGLADAGALGDDEHGRFMVNQYRARLTEVLALMSSKTR